MAQPTTHRKSLARLIAIADAAGLRRFAVRVHAVLATLALACVTPLTAQPPATAGGTAEPMWVNHVEPVLNRACIKCHGGAKQKGGLDLRLPGSIFAGGADGSVVTPGRPGESALYQRLQVGVEGHMPPEKEPQLTVEEISFVREWIATLPTASDHPPLADGAGSDAGQPAASLIEAANRVRWQPPAGVEGSATIDFLVERRWRERQVAGAAVCDDRTFVRRLYLDLAGRIPTRDEADAFVGSARSSKRAELVDQLLSGGDYPRHMADVMDVVLMERKGPAAEAARRSHHWMEYLQSSFATGRPWNVMVADLITARPASAEQNGAAWFLYERKNNYQAMAEAVAPVAFGVSVACAQCHNHPLAHEIKQQHYWGLVAAFNRSANVEGDGVALSESAVGGFVNFTNLKKESQPATLAFPNDRTVAEKRPAEGAKEEDSDDNYIVPPLKGKGPPKRAAVPKFSRRQIIADAATRDNPLLARAFVNRMWGLLMGRAFVNPVDQMDSRHPPSHPELLAWLSVDFERSGYDVKHLIRTIVLSRTYQLESRWGAATPPPAPELFARGLEKPLSAEVLYRSLLTATRGGVAGRPDAADTDALRQALIVTFPTLYDSDYSATLQQAMFLTNSPKLDALLHPEGENLAVRLLKLPTSEARVRTAFLDVLGRPPDETELRTLVAYLDARSERPDAADRQLMWTLLTCTEFLTNH